LDSFVPLHPAKAIAAAVNRNGISVFLLIKSLIVEVGIV
jgi:hypothetical protein